MAYQAPEEWLKMLRKQAAPREGIHITDLLGCPRKKRLLEEGAEVDLAALEARLEGSLIHDGLERANPDGAELPVRLSAFGLDLVGRMDRLDGDTVVDYKGGKSRPPDAPYAEWVWQAQMYRRALKEPTRGYRIWKKAPVGWRQYDWQGPLATEADLGAMRPHDGAFTVLELATQLASGKPAAQLPMVGATQKIGKKSACEYCECRAACEACVPEVDL
jgi:hypothetical protein